MITKNIQIIDIASQATPTISVNSSGLITASTTQSAGYVMAGTKSVTHQLAFQPATTYMPTTADQIISSNQYLIGNQTIKGDANFLEENIAEGVTMWGKTGTHSGGGTADGYTADDIATRNIIEAVGSATSICSNAFVYYSGLTTVSFPNCTSIGSSAFAGCHSLTTVSFPNCTSINSYAFQSCRSLTTASFPKCTSIMGGAFRYCTGLTTVSFPNCTYIGSSVFNMGTGLTTVSFPNCTYIGGYAFGVCQNLTTASLPKCTSIMGSAFYYCTKLTTASFPVCKSIGSYAFNQCCNLTSLYLTGSSVCKLSASNAFSSTPIGGYSTSAGTYGSIYVPASLLTQYQSATNWTYFSSRFVAYDENGGG